MMNNKFTLDDFLGKIEWEGGVEEAMLGYGLTTEDYDLPEDLKTAWDEAQEILSRPGHPLNQAKRLIEKYEA